MATTIKLKNGSGAPAASDLVQGEPAIDLTNKRLYTEDSGGSVIEVGTNPSSLSIDGTAVTATATEINTLDGITSTTAELNILDGVTSTAAELNILDGVTASTAEINLLDGVTSTTAELNILDGVTATAAELNVLDGVTAFVDEDDMVSNSATAIPSQQSVKAYVDSTIASEVTAQDLDFQGDTGGALSIDLDSETLTIAGGTGIDTSGATNTLTVAIDSTVATLTGSQTLTNKTLTTPVISSISNTGTLTLPTSTDTLIGRDTTDTLTNKTLTSPVLNTGVSGTAILDEDDMASDSATQLATQQSIKAYVDSQVASADTLAELTDTNITTPADGALLFYDTGTSKWIDNVVSGDITIADTGVAAIGSGVIVNDDINASAAISVSKTALVDGTGLTLTGDTLSVDASQTQITAVGTIGTGTWQGSVITNTYVADDLTINGGTIENTPIGAATPNTGEFTTLTVSGDLTVDTNVLKVDATNNRVGIGTQSPTALLDVAASLNPTIRLKAGLVGNDPEFDDQYMGGVEWFTNDTSGIGAHVGASIRAFSEATGTSTTPSYSLIFSTSLANTVESEAMRITRKGNVGIGTDDPSSPNGFTRNLTISGSSCSLALDETDVNTWEMVASSGSFRIYDETDERLRVDASGNVGIGVSNPTNGKLCVDGSINITTTSGTYVAGALGYTDSNWGFLHRPPRVGANAAHAFQSFSGSTLMAVTDGGNVGIGNYNPTFALDIDNGNDNIMELNGSTTTLRFVNTDSSIFRIQTPGGSDSIEHRVASGGTHRWNITSTEAMRIDSSGNLLVGYSSTAASRIISKGVSNSSSNYTLYCLNSDSTLNLYVRNDGIISTGTDGNSPYYYGVSGRDLYVNSAGVLGYLSSIRESKANIQALDDISWLYNLNPVSFNYRQKNDETTVYTDEVIQETEYGLIADEVEQVNADLCFYDEDEEGSQTLAGVSYRKLIPVLTKAIQEQQAMIETLQAQVAELQGAS